MTARNCSRILVVAAAAALLVGCGISDPYATAPAPTSTSTSTATTIAASRPGGGALTAAQINRQDHPPGGLVRRQHAATRARPMLPALPITTDGVRIAIGGLGRDGQTTILTLTSRGRRDGRAHALGVYRRQLRRYGDSGHAYRPRVRP
jgi:hypothetical protein